MHVGNILQKEAAIDEDYKGKREACDEFEMFGRSIASQLRNINFGECRRIFHPALEKWLHSSTKFYVFFRTCHIQ